MSKSLKMKLSSKGVSDLIKRLGELEQKTDLAVRASMAEMAIPTTDRIRDIAEIRRDTGESIAGIGWEFPNNNTMIIYQEGTHVFENEFGNGEGFGEYPKPEVIPSGQPTKPGKYTFTPTSEKSRWFAGYLKDGKTMKKVPARGQTADAQMYLGAMFLREELPKKIKQKVGEVLSQI